MFQRWTDLSATKSSTLTRYVFDGSTLVQEHEWGATISESAYVYTYNHITRDYLYQSGGIRQRESSDGFTFTDRFLVTDGGPITASIDQGVTTNVTYNELAASGDRQAAGSHQNGKLSNLYSPDYFLEGYGGGTSGATAGFEPLIAPIVIGGIIIIGGLLLGGLIWWLTHRHSTKNDQSDGAGQDSKGCPDCCWEFYSTSSLSTREGWMSMCGCPGNIVGSFRSMRL